MNPREKQSRHQEKQSQKGRHQEEEEQQQENEGNNILSGFDEKLLAEVFGIDTRLARKLQNENDNRGAIVNVEHEFQITSPEEIEEEQQSEQGRQEEQEEEEEEDEDEEEQRRSRRQGPKSRKDRRGERGSRNGIEETFCTMRLKHKTDSSFADIFNPRAGRITTVNNFNFPVLRNLQLSAERGVLYKVDI